MTRRLLVPAPADYWYMDLTLDEERQRLRYEFAALTHDQLISRLRNEGREIEEMYGLPVATLIEELVDTVCPRGWLDRRLSEAS